MVENDFTVLAHNVVEQWRDENVRLNIGATEDEFLAFEKRFAITLPPDFRYLYSLVNGMANYGSDKYFFSLWPLEWIATKIEGEKEPFEKRDEEACGNDRGNSVCSAIVSLFRGFAVAQKKPSQMETIRQPL